MWHKECVKIFLEERETPEDVSDQIMARAEEVADELGFFSAGAIEVVMGDPELAQAFEDAWESSPGKYFVSPKQDEEG